MKTGTESPARSVGSKLAVRALIPRLAFAGALLAAPSWAGGAIPIYDIQGSGSTSSYVGQMVQVVGVVTGDFQDGASGAHGDLDGFFLQQATGDGDPATSDGIFVFDGASPATNVQVGDLVEVFADVQEVSGETRLDATGGSVAVMGTGSVSATALTMPFAATFVNDDGREIADLEALEGMLVSAPADLTVTELYQLDRFGELLLAEGGGFFQFTQTSLPDATGFASHLADVAKRSLVLDDGLTIQNPDPIRYPSPGLATSNPVRWGDTVNNLVGNIRFSRGSGGSGDQIYRLEPTAEPVFTSSPRPAAPAAGGPLRVAFANILNFFTTLDDGSTTALGFAPRGANNSTEYDRQLEKLVTAIVELDADVLGLAELENDFTPTGPLPTLVGAVNAELGSPVYAAVHPGADFFGVNVLSVGLMYKVSTVSPAPGTMLASPSDDPGDPLFSGPTPNNLPIAVTFQENATGSLFTVSVNHFKSKGASGLANPGSVCDPDPTADPDCDQGDGQAFWNARRTEAAAAVATWLATDPTGSNDPDVLIVGDLNSYMEEDPIHELEGHSYVNLTAALVDPHTYLFDGQLGSLDYAFASPFLNAQVEAVAEWHSNAAEADGLDYNLDFGRNAAIFDGMEPYRTSDHDQVVVDFELASDCLDNVMLENESVDGLYRARQSISTGVAVDVTGGGDTTFRAGDRIELGNGFSVPADAEFEADAGEDPC